MNYLALKEVIEPVFGTRIVQRQEGGSKFPVYGGGGITFHADTHNREDDLVVARFAMSKNCVRFVKGKFFLNDSGLTIKVVNNKFSQEFVQWFLLSQQELVYNCSRGAAQRNIDMSRFLSLKIPVLKKDEQNKIVSLQKKTTILLEKRRQSLAKLDQLAQSIFLDMFGDPVTNPKGWPKRKFSEMVPNIESGWSPVCESRPAAANEKGVLKLGAVTWCHYNDQENKAFLDESKFDPSIEVKDGDVLFCRKNTLELVAGSAFVFKTREGLMMSDLIFRINPSSDSGLDPIYFWKFLATPSMKSQIQSFAGGSAGSMPNISKEKLKNIWILTPPFELQKSFSKKIRFIKNLETKHNSSLDQIEQLRQSLSQRFFGENT